MTCFSITQTTRTAYPKHPYEKIKDDILGRNYTLSLSFIGATRAQGLNKDYRKKNYTPNVLSFPLEDKHGEIFITPAVARKEAKKFSMTEKGYVGFLFIHACLHLKGHHHGATMERAEKKYCQKYRMR